MGIAKAAVNHAWRNGELDRPIPFASLPDGPNRERALSVEELGRLWDTAMSEHVRMFLVLLLGTAGRPEAVLELTRFQCDLDRSTINLNPLGRPQTKKRRRILPMADFLRPWIEAAPAGPLVVYRGQAVRSLSHAFQNLRDAAGFGRDVTAYAIRHTVATELARRGVPPLEIAGFLGHRMPDFRTMGRYVHVAPDHLANARRALDDLARAATRTMVPDNMRASRVLVV
jgi:integrase